MRESQHIPDWSLVQQYMRASPSIFFYWRAETDWPVEHVSENVSQFGYSAEEFISGRKKFSEIVHPQDLDRVIQEVEEYTAKKLKSFTQQYRVLGCEGDIRWIDDHTVTQCNAAGEVTHYLGIVTDITERKNSEAALKFSQEKYRALVESTVDFVWEVDRKGIYTYCSPQVESLLGYTPGEMLGKTPFEFMTAEDAETVAGKFREIVGKRQAFPALENTNIHRDGREIVLETSGVPFFDADGGLAGYRGIDRDITERKRTQQRLAAQQEFLQSVIDGVHDSIMVVNEDCTIQLMNQVARDAMQPEFVADIDHPKCYEVSHHFNVPCDGKDHPCPLKKVIESGEAVTVIHRHPLADSSIAYMELLTSPLQNEGGEIRSVIEVARDVTGHVSARRELEEQKLALQKLAHHDALTGLPNRLLFLDRLQQAIRKARRADRLLAVLFIDLDRFKQINDSLGHSMGDTILKVIAGRLEGCLREDDVVARLGGDEFTIIMDSLHNARHATTIAQKVIRAVQRPVRHEEHELYVSASVGISLYPQDGEDAEILLRNADAAMYRAKGEGENSFQFYTADMTEQAFERVLMESYLHRAMENDQFVLFYQPQIELGTGRLVGLEALLRWQHPEQGLVLPAKFITLAEDTGLILPLGEWVLRTTCRQMATWYRAGLYPGRVAVNLTARQLHNESFLPMMEKILDESRCQAEWLELEITEGVIMRQHEHSFQILQQLKGLGIELAIDDFGTSCSSLAYLKRLPVSKLKIDRSFVRDVPEDDSENAIVRAVIALGHSLGLRVIAEGVENSGQMAFLREEGCDEVQGYLYGEPLPADQITERLRNMQGTGTPGPDKQG